MSAAGIPPLRPACSSPTHQPPLTHSPFGPPPQQTPDCIVKPDGLRTVTLLARDVASLATALCAGTEEMSDAWRVLALQHDEAFSGTAEQGRLGPTEGCVGLGWGWVWVLPGNCGKVGGWDTLPQCTCCRLQSQPCFVLPSLPAPCHLPILLHCSPPPPPPPACLQPWWWCGRRWLLTPPACSAAPRPPPRASIGWERRT